MNHSLQEHLQQIINEQAKVMAERSTGELLQQLEHSIKGVVRPTLHAALIVASNCDTEGMVFSEIARKQDGQWGWMDAFRSSRICLLLSETIRCNKDLQRCLHIVDYASGTESATIYQAYRERLHELDDDSLSLVQELVSAKTQHGRIEVPPGVEAKQLVLDFMKYVAQLVDTNLVLASKLAQGMLTLRHTQVRFHAH